MTEQKFADRQGEEFDHVDLTGSRFSMTRLDNTRFVSTIFSRVVMRGVEISDMNIDGDIDGLIINGVEVMPLVEAELDRLHPDRVLFRPEDPAGFRRAWDLNETLWAATVDRARHLDPELLHESVDEEWSFVQTLRHLAFATQSWVGRAVLGDPYPWHPLSLPWAEMPATPGVPDDRDARPRWDEAWALRRDAMGLMRHVVDGLTVDQLAATTAPALGPGWPPEGATFPVQKCLRIVLNEEWWHRMFAERDLAILEAR